MITAWLTRNIFILGLVSLLSDFSHEMTTVVLPSFLLSLGATPAILGFIEGVADASISFMKLFAGWYSDVLSSRKPFAVIGYALTAVGVGLFVIARSWYMIFFGRVIAWSGKGLRKPPRDALLVESTEPSFYGRVFGFHRGMDTFGGIVGPLAAFMLIPYVSYRMIFLIALIPGILAVIFMLRVQEPAKKKDISNVPSSFTAMPHQFWWLATSSLFFGLGKFADSLFILRITQMLHISDMMQATRWAILLYTVRNLFYAGGAYPLGVMADLFGKKRMLVSGYLLAAAAAIMLGNATSLSMIIVTSIVLGISLAITDATEKSVAADFIPSAKLGTGFGILALIGGITAFISSFLIGILWTTYSASIGFLYSAIMAVMAAVVLGVMLPQKAH